MPDRGLLEAAAAPDVEFAGAGGFALTSASWFQATFEVSRDAALAFMPTEVGRPIPPYGRLLVASSAQGNLALLSVGGRYRMMPRNIVVAALLDGMPDGATATFGGASAAGRVSLRREGAYVSAEVSGPGGPLVRARLPDLYAIEPTMLRWDASVVIGRSDGLPALAEVAPAHEVVAAFLSRAASLEVEPTLSQENAWRRLQSLNPISTCYAEGTLAFGAPSVAQAWT